MGKSEFSNCANFCTTLRARLTEELRFPWRYINYGQIALFCILLPLSIIISMVQCCILGKKKLKGLTETQAGLTVMVQTPVTPEKPEESVSLPQEISANPKFGDPVDEKYSLEDVVVPSPVGKRVTKPCPQYTKADYERLRKHIKDTREEHKKITHESNFPNWGPIFIPREPHIPPADKTIPKDIVLKDVWYNPKNNGMHEIGSDVDDIELEPSTGELSESTESVTLQKRTSTLTGEDRIAMAEQEEMMRKGESGEKTVKDKAVEEKKKEAVEENVAVDRTQSESRKTPKKKTSKKSERKEKILNKKGNESSEEPIEKQKKKRSMEQI